MEAAGQPAAALALCALILAGCGGGPGAAPPVTVPSLALPPMRTFAPHAAPAPARSNTEMARDFADLSFSLESGRPLEAFSRYEGPIRVRMTGEAPATAAEDLGRLLARLRAEAGIDIRPATTGDEAEITIAFLPRRVMQARVPRAACFVAPRVGSWDEYRRARRGDLDWTTITVRDRAAIFIPNDTAPQEIRDCLHEELAQALGPLNDLYRLPDSVFNDDNIHTVLTGFDMLMLRATYAPELRSGMTPGAVNAAIPSILARLNPRGQRGGSAFPDPTPRAYVDAIETALGPGAGQARREAAARTAVAIATERGWTDGRAGFAWLALGRLTLARDLKVSEGAFRQAEIIYSARPGFALQQAHVDMQLSAFALSAGRIDEVLARTARAAPLAAGAENAALLSSLLMVRAEALDLAGRPAEARQVRLDSLGWARYGFGSDAEIRDRLAGIAALVPIAITRP
ncbi:MAG: DUF2927 domain-containing protein [Rhodobacteraceae bacterium]|nr:DUF2927 domain-containing protein [Paracoccaceae bacterium]